MECGKDMEKSMKRKVSKKDIPDIIAAIQQSTIDDILKEGILVALNDLDDFYPDIDTEDYDFVRCDSEDVIAYCKKYNCDVKKAREHCEKNLHNFPYVISTEDYYILYW